MADRAVKKESVGPFRILLDGRGFCAGAFGAGDGLEAPAYT
jgi:hypothetical protein